MFSENKPIFIIGPPRSGTTLLTTMLNSHPDIFIANEAKFFVRLLPKYLGRKRFIDEREAARIISGYESNELYYLKPLPKAGDVLGAARRMDAVTFIRALFARIAEREGKRRWGEKTAVAYRQLDLVRASFPDSVLIGLDRNPYEIAASYERINPKWGALGALVHWLDFKRAVAAKCDEGMVCMVSYDELIQNPGGTLRNVCQHIGEDYDQAMLEYYRTPRAASLSIDKTYEGSAKPLYTSSRSLEYLQNGITGCLMRRLIADEPVIRQDATALYRAVKAWVYVRAVLWELRSRLIRQAE